MSFCKLGLKVVGKLVKSQLMHPILSVGGQEIRSSGFSVSVWRRRLVSVVFGVTLLGGSAWATSSSRVSPPQETEPSYCDPARFDEKEFSIGSFESQQAAGLVRTHAFKLGKITLIGLGVGNSKAKAMIQLFNQYSEGEKNPNYCTWYLNHPKGVAEDVTRYAAAKTFIHRDIEKSPVKMNEHEATEHFLSVLQNVFSKDSTSFLSCAEKSHYLALGCNEMMHRGPTVFGMLLAYSGCRPENALEITNQVWGLNGVKRKVRLAVIEKAYDLGSSQAEARKKLADLFSQPTELSTKSQLKEQK